MHQTEKEHREERAAVDRAREANYYDMLLHSRPDTWSARMPAYAYTALCPDPELRLKE